MRVVGWLGFTRRRAPHHEGQFPRVITAWPRPQFAAEGEKSAWGGQHLGDKMGFDVRMKAMSKRIHTSEGEIDGYLKLGLVAKRRKELGMSDAQPQNA